MQPEAPYFTVHKQLTTRQLQQQISTGKRKVDGFLWRKQCRYPIMIVNTNGIHHRDLVDTSAGSSYGSAALLNYISGNLVKQETRQTQILLHTTSKKIEEHNIIISNQEGSFKLNVQDTTSILQSS